MKKTNVLNIIGKRPQGGIGAFVYNYQLNMNKNIIQMDYMIFNDKKEGDFDNKVKALGSNVYVLSELKNSRLFTIINEINNFFKENSKKIDIIHIHSANIAFICLPIAKRYGISKCIVHSHATKYSDKKLNAVRNYFLCKFIYRYSPTLFACSYAAGRFLYGKKKPFKVINNAINITQFCFKEDLREKKRKELNLTNKFVIGNVGRFCNQKNHLFLLKVFKKIKTLQKNSVLMLIGSGEKMDVIKNFVIENNLKDDVLFLGQRNDVNELMQAMDVFVLPSLYEGFPVVGVEAECIGLPCFYSDTITTEIGLINSFFISLKENDDYWAKKIFEVCTNFNRKREDLIMRSLGYDIKQEAESLQNFYVEFNSVD